MAGTRTAVVVFWLIRKIEKGRGGFLELDGQLNGRLVDDHRTNDLEIEEEEQRSIEERRIDR